MKYRITHTTTYLYESPVRVCHNLVMLTPRDDALVRVRSHRLKVWPQPDLLHQRTDFFGNRLHAFSIEVNHRSLKVTAMSRVRVLARKLPELEQSPSWEQVVGLVETAQDQQWLQASPFLFDSRRIQRNTTLAEYALQDFTPGRPLLICLRDFMARIYREFEYDTKATFVSTLPLDAFAIKRGVCQDFAQVAIGALRSLGLPARYVSGYLRTIPPAGKERLIGADQSHAWVGVYCGQHLGWIQFDPTNNCFCGTDHVPIALGRDYDDVVPVRGVFLGGGQHTLRVSVDVLPIAS